MKKLESLLPFSMKFRGIDTESMPGHFPTSHLYNWHACPGSDNKNLARRGGGKRRGEWEGDGRGVMGGEGERGRGLGEVGGWRAKVGGGGGRRGRGGGEG